MKIGKEHFAVPQPIAMIIYLGMLGASSASGSEGEMCRYKVMTTHTHGWERNIPHHNATAL